MSLATARSVALVAPALACTRETPPSDFPGMRLLALSEARLEREKALLKPMLEHYALVFPVEQADLAQFMQVVRVHGDGPDLALGDESGLESHGGGILHLLFETLLAIPLSVGKAGQFTSTFQILGAAGGFTVDFYAWTPHTLSFMGLTSKGAALPDVVAMGSFDLTAHGAGTVTLVAPTKVSAQCALLSQRRISSLTTLKLHFVPEPSTLLLLAAGALGLVLAQRRGRPSC